MKEKEIKARLQALVDSFDPDDCIDFGYEAVEEIEDIIKEMENGKT